MMNDQRYRDIVRAFKKEYDYKSQSYYIADIDYIYSCKDLLERGGAGAIVICPMEGIMPSSNRCYYIPFMYKGLRVMSWRLIYT